MCCKSSGQVVQIDAPLGSSLLDFPRPNLQATVGHDSPDTTGPIGEDINRVLRAAQDLLSTIGSSTLCGNSFAAFITRSPRLALPSRGFMKSGHCTPSIPARTRS